MHLQKGGTPHLHIFNTGYEWEEFAPLGFDTIYKLQVHTCDFCILSVTVNQSGVSVLQEKWFQLRLIHICCKKITISSTVKEDKRSWRSSFFGLVLLAGARSKE